MSDRPLLILNPASAGGRTGRRGTAIHAEVDRALGGVDLVQTDGPGHARRIAAEAVRAGRRCLLVGGGDGTASEVAAGVLDETKGEGGPALALLPLGSGGDLARTLEMPSTLAGVLALVRTGTIRHIDAGVLGGGASPAPGSFVNEASAGLSATTIRLVGRFAKRVGARIGFALGAVAAILGHRPVPLVIRVDDVLVHDGPTSLVVIANGRFFGAGMRVAPRARVDDGRFEVVVVRALGVLELLANLPSLFVGTHGEHPGVSFHTARRVVVEAGPGIAEVDRAIDVDGEAGGRLPLEAEIRPAALAVFAPIDPESSSGAPDAAPTRPGP